MKHTINSKQIFTVYKLLSHEYNVINYSHSHAIAVHYAAIVAGIYW